MADTTFRVPGRIEVLGKHVDYAGGRSLLCATERAFTIAVTRTATGMLRLRDAVSGQQHVVDPATVAQRGPSGGPAWSVYPRAVVRRVVADFGPDAVPGCDVEFSSDIPSSSGMSSSSAFVTGLFLALDMAADLLGSEKGRRGVPDLPSLAEYVGAIESGHVHPGFEATGDAGRADGVGVRGGAQDHTAILCSRPGALVQAAFGPVRLERVAELPAGLRFVIGVSGVRAPKARSARERYNALSDRARSIGEIWRAMTGEGVDIAPHLGAVIGRLRGEGATPEAAAARVADVLRRSGDPDAEALTARVEQFVTETEVLVPGVADALAAGDLGAVGPLVNRSQELTDRVLDNQVPATRALAASARELGALGASAFGAGFGGGVWALVPEGEASAFTRAWRERYLGDFPMYRQRADFFQTAAADPAGPLPERFRS